MFLVNNSQQKHMKPELLNMVNLNIRIYWCKLGIICLMTIHFSSNMASHSNLANIFWCWLIKKTSLEWRDSSYDLKKEKEIVSRQEENYSLYIRPYSLPTADNISLFLAIGYPLTSLYNIHGGGKEQFNTTARPTENFHSTLKACHICPINW